MLLFGDRQLQRVFWCFVLVIPILLRRCTRHNSKLSATDATDSITLANYIYYF